MGSLSASGIPVPAKTPNTYRKFDRILIKKSDNRTDSDDVVVAQGLPARPIGSGSIVRDDNMSAATVEYYEDVVWGVYQGGRSTQSRIASASGASRSLNVDSVVPDFVVFPSGDAEQKVVHTGNRLVLSRPSGDELVERVVATGTFG